MKKLYLVDASSLFFRAFYAIRPLTSPQGVPVNAVYGYLSMIVKLLKDEKPDYLVFCYDRKEPSFRKALYNDYKANRTEMPADLVVQMPYIKKLADLLGIASLERESYEADDIIGSLTKYGTHHGCEVVIVSGDKDFAQLLEPRVALLDTLKDTRISVAGTIEKWGVKPEQMIDYLAIVGDSSDNVPGVSGLGPKGAVKLLTEYGSLDGIYKNIDSISSASIKDKLLKSKEQAYLSQKLVTIVTDLEITHNLEEFKIQNMNKEELRLLLQELNFKTFEKNLLSQDSLASSGVVASAAATAVVVIPEKKVVSDWSPEEVSLDIDAFTQQLQPAQDLWVLRTQSGFLFSDRRKIFRVEGDYTKMGKVTDQKMIQWQGFNLKSIWHELGCQTPMISFDGMLASYVLKSGDTNNFSKVVGEYLHEEASELDQPVVLFDYLFQLEKVLVSLLKERMLWDVYQNFEVPLAAVLLRMELRGIKIDLKFLAEFHTELENEIQHIETRVHDLAAEKFNVASPKQLGVILFEKLKLPVIKKTKTGFSTDNDVLEQLSHPIVKEILDFRELSKLKSTYVDALPLLADPETHRLHTNFNQALTSTGRLSSTKPNLQNIPIRTERGQKVRKAFIAEGNRQLLSLDYSQIELRILAHISDDPGLIQAFKDDLDIHSATAAEIFNIDLTKVSSEQRRIAKAVNFGIAYGQGAFGLASTLRIGRTEAQEIIRKYFERFKGVREYIETTTKEAHEKGYVETLIGRRRYIDELQSKNQMIRKFGERAAINAPIQGTASDLVKKAMIEIEREIPVPMLLQVHDELIFEDSPERLQEYQKPIQKIMESVTQLKVPLKVNAAIGINWDEAH